jgi:glucose/arabinose dehydrogenase
MKLPRNLSGSRALRLLPLLLLTGSLAAWLLICGVNSGSDPFTPLIRLERIAAGFSRPVHITHAGDGSGRIFVVEQAGRIRILKNRALTGTPFLDIRDIVRSTGSEQGLLSVGFPPGYGGTGRFYVNYTGKQGVGDTVVARYRRGSDPDIADSASAEIILTVAQPYSNHNGGQLAFGPDGLLYIGMGDGGSGGDPFNHAQTPGSLLGKLLRIGVESGVSPYEVPTGNPFISAPGYRPEIWALGLRNPWRFSFDRGTGDLYIGDVGQNAREEIDYQPASSPGGENYGWRIMEGMHCYASASCSRSGLTLPAAEYRNPADGCSVTGGFVYRGQKYPALQGTYIYGDFCSGRIWGLRKTGAGWENRPLLESSLSVSTFGEDEDGNLYVADYSAGVIYEIGEI